MIWVCVCGHLVCGSRAAVGSIVGALRARFRPFVIGRATGRSATRRRRPCSSFLFFCGCIQVALSIPVRSDGSHSIFCSPFFFVLTGRHFCSLVAPPTHRKQQNKIGWFFFFCCKFAEFGRVGHVNERRNRSSSKRVALWAFLFHLQFEKKWTEKRPAKLSPSSLAHLHAIH